jgi:four helix bundle protein
MTDVRYIGMHKYKDLKIWLKAMNLVKNVYAMTSKFPDKERFGLISQINRAAISIPSNIAEGAGRNSDAQFMHFISIAHASSYELETQLILSQALGYITNEQLKELLASITELQKMSFSLQKTLKS